MNRPGPRRIPHLVSRFFGSLRPRALDADTVEWVESELTAGELQVWRGLGRADREESVAVARRFEVASPEADNPAWIAAALLHDAGKQASAYGPFGRAFVTVVITVAGSDVVRGWAGEPGRMKRRMGCYAAHDDLGAELLRAAGARPEAVAWAAAHHRPDRWRATGIPAPVCRALATADGE
jgi:hypothetical protein